MEFRLAFIGFGNVARAFARVLHSRRELLASRYDITLRAVGVATARHGSAVSDEGIDLIEASAALERGARVTDLKGVRAAEDAYEVIERCRASLLFETTTLSPLDGEPAASYIKGALERGINVVTANKGPVAFAYRELKSLAERSRACFRFEGTVMDGAPVFNLAEFCLPGASIEGFSGVLNSTTNVVLDAMERGRSLEESLDEARKMGVAEANPDFDIDGWDAAVKAVVLANVLMGADVRPGEVEREGIRGIRQDDIRSARNQGMTIRLVARSLKEGGNVRLRVAPERIPADSALGSTRGTTNSLILRTDLMGDIAIIENNPGVEQTAYALLSDMIRVRSGTTL
ncbi:MAG TPA: homoserine dehydrogenase [Blastocatellia bacterium]|nr:homoserine dehydrogenase [Blastocatellia bacterium]